MKENIRMATERDTRAVQDAVNGWWKEDKKRAVHRLDWWKKARFGCFIHWGVYAVAGGEYKGHTTGYAEHLERALTIPLEEYKEEMIDQFTAENFDAEAWIREAKNAGMEYFVITAKHHDGFAMYPSDVYPYDIRMTPFGRDGRDPMQELKDACDKYDMKFGFYYSHAFDWEHPKAPGNDWVYKNPGGDLHLYEEEYGLWYYDHPELLPAIQEYVDQKSIPQILELIKMYHPDILWFDTPHKLPISENLRILKAIRDADPNVVVNGRLARTPQYPSLADYYNTADRPAMIYPSAGYWEGIPTTNESYGYHKLDHSHKPAPFFMNLMAQSAARGGNMLMNIGPRGDGSWDPADLAILRPLGDWIRAHRESLYDVGRNPLPKQYWGEVTCKGSTLYLHVFSCDADGCITLAGLLSPIESITVLGTDADATSEKAVALEKDVVSNGNGTDSGLDYEQDGYYDVRIALPHVHCKASAPEREQDTEQRDSSVQASSAQAKAAAPVLPCVLKVETAGRIEAYPIRRLQDNGADLLHVYDADYVSEGLEYGQGKIINDYVSGFTHPSQQVIWKVRNNGCRRYRAEVTYQVLKEGDGGSYRLRVGTQEYIREIAADEYKKYMTDHCDIEYPVSQSGHLDIQLSPETIKGSFAAFRSVKLTPMYGTEKVGAEKGTEKRGLAEQLGVAEADATDTGENVF